MQYICVCAQFVRHAREVVFVLYSSKKWVEVLISTSTKHTKIKNFDAFCEIRYCLDTI